MEHVYVTNNSGEPHRDTFRGEVYDFPVGKSVKVPHDFAVECLGHGWENKLPFITRLGWAKTTNDLPQAVERLEKFQITQEPVEKDRYMSPAVGEVTPFPETGRGRKSAVRAA